MRDVVERMGREIGFLAVLAAVAGAPACAQTSLPVDDGRWEVSGDAAPGRMDGQAVLNLRTAEVDRRGLTFSDGTVEFDMKVTSRRTFVGVKLRTTDGGTYEDIYVRPHKSGLPDAIQYDPTYRKSSGWQLYHGPGATAFAWYEPGRWEHVRVEVKGRQAAVFLGDDKDPALVVPHLRAGPLTGGLGFWALQPGATEDDPWTASLANIVVHPGVTSYAFAPPAPEEPAPGSIRRWQVSESREGEAADLDALPGGLSGGPWKVADAEASGLVNLDRELVRPDARSALAFARLRIRAARTRTVRLDLGYSDNATVFLDGRPVFTGRFSYSYNFPRRDGLITPDQATVHLALTPGDHEVVVAVSDVFGGWGLMGRILDRDGIRILEP